MGILTCKINSLWEKQLIKNEYTNEEYWVPIVELPDTLHSLITENESIKGVWFEGPLSDCNDVVYRYINKYPKEELSYTIN